MRRYAFAALTAVALGGAAYFATNLGCRHTPIAHCRCTGWLQAEFHVDEATCERIRLSQLEFARACEHHCAEVNRAESAMAALPATATPGDRAGAHRTLLAAKERCRLARVDQAHRVASMLPVDCREKYLAIVLPKLEELDHAGAPRVDGTR